MLKIALNKTHLTSISAFKPALEGRAIVNLQMSNAFGAYQDISGSINLGPTAELYTNRGVINQVRYILESYEI